MNKTITIPLGPLNLPREISSRIRNAGIETYNYAFTDQFDRVIKFGIQYSSKKGRQAGDRVYRQAGWLDGWGFYPSSANGSEMQQVAIKYKARYGFPLNRQNVKIVIWDKTNASLSTDEMRDICEEVEKQQISNHIEIHGRAPVGNNEISSKKGERNQKTKDRLADVFDFA